jgi:hypothetical protein
MKQSEYLREQARILDMIEGTSASTSACVKYRGSIFPHLALHTTPDNVEFAVCLVEGKPAFAGDTVWDIVGEKYVTIKGLLGDSLYVSVHGGLDVLIAALRWKEPEAVDPYAEVRAAQSAGKVVLFDSFYDDTRWIDANANGAPFEFAQKPDRYKIMEEDVIEEFTLSSKINYSFKIEVTTSHLTGEKSVKLIDKN